MMLRRSTSSRVRGLFSVLLLWAVIEGKPGRHVNDCSSSLVFGVGLPKSGTRSLQGYFNMLGYRVQKAGTPNNFMYSFKDDLLPFAADPFAATNFSSLGSGRNTMYCDFPFYALTCQLARAFPAAKFVLVERDCDEWAASALRQLFCQWMSRTEACSALHRPRLRPPPQRSVPHSAEYHIGRAHRHSGFVATQWYLDQFDDGLVTTICRDAHRICTNHKPRVVIRKRLAAICRTHGPAVRNCVPKERLAVVTLEHGPNFTESHGSVAEFVGCDRNVDKAAGKWQQQGHKGAYISDAELVTVVNRRAP